MKRRDLLGYSAATLATGVAAAKSGKAKGAAAGDVVSPPDLSFLQEGSLVNAARAREQMAEAGVDAIVALLSPNVFHLTGHWPQADRMGHGNTALAILPRDPLRPLAVILPGFVHYYVHSGETPAGERLVFTYNAPDPAAVSSGPDGEPAALPTGVYPIYDPNLVTPREQQRRASAAAVRAVSAGMDWALVRALRELRLDAATLACDHGDIALMLGRRELAVRCVPGDNLLRRIRLVKSPREIQLLRLAAQLNVDAAVAAARSARSAGTTRVLRARYFAAAAARGLMPLFMVIDQSSSEVQNAELREGQCFAIDCVSTLRFYHGDFARSVFIGEPRGKMKEVVDKTNRAWQDVRAALRPGLRFADIPRIGKESIKRQGGDFNISFSPHCVGLYHGDQPWPTPQEPQAVAALTLQEGMVLSVDCPLGHAGVGGSSHLEDLSLITKEGSEPLHTVPPNVFVV
jgi:Xaa-Pro aminopeptidase